MAYMGSEAYHLDQWEEPARSEGASAQPAPRRRFRTIEGGGLDAEARRGVSPRFWSVVKTTLAVVAAVLIVWGVNVAVRAGTVTLKAENNTLTTQVATLQDENRDLQVTRSLLSSEERIARIATQNYGMVRVTPSATITVDAG